MIKQLICLAILALFCGCGKPSRAPSESKVPERIVSLAPNITETVFALGLGSSLVGVTSSCTYPEQALSVPRVGGYGQFNFETIYALQPDLVILHKEHETEKARLSALGLPCLETKSYFIADIMETIQTIGDACGASGPAENLINTLKTRMASVAPLSDNPPRVLIFFNRQPTSGAVAQVHAFGQSCLHNELVEFAGGQNVVTSKQPFVILSREALLRLNPDIIIELTTEEAEAPNAWFNLSTITAVKNDCITVLHGRQHLIPGPRFVETLEAIAHAIRSDK